MDTPHLSRRSLLGGLALGSAALGSGLGPGLVLPAEAEAQGLQGSLPRSVDTVGP